MKEDKRYYSNAEVTVLMVIEQKLLEILDEEYYQEDINTSHIAAICMGLLETYKEINLKQEITTNDFKDLEIFINNNRKDIIYSLFDLLNKFKETDKIDKIKYC